MTESTTPSASEWLSNEDAKNYRDRSSRLELIVNLTPANGPWVFLGAPLTKYLFEEARYCYVYGQFLATVILGLAYIEHTLAASLYGAGHDDAERARLPDLLVRARDRGLIDGKDYTDVEEIHAKRNAYAHFRKPLDKESVEYRSVKEDELPYTIIEQDATTVISVALRLVGRSML